MRKRNLSGVFIRAKNPDTGKWDAICFEDLDEKAQDEFLATKSLEWIKELVKILAKQPVGLADYAGITKNSEDIK